jgi:hypothetical protein
MKILEKMLFWSQKWIFKNLGELYIVTVNIKVADNNLNYNLSETIYL